MLENGTGKALWGFEIRTGHPISTGRTYLVLIIKKRTWHLVDFAVPAEHNVKIKEREKIDRYKDFARERKNLWNMRMMVIAIVDEVIIFFN